MDIENAVIDHKAERFVHVEAPEGFLPGAEIYRNRRITCSPRRFVPCSTAALYARIIKAAYNGITNNVHARAQFIE